MAQERVQKTKTSSKRAVQEADVKAKTKDDEAEALKEHSDDLLDEIDSLLEENAAEFVASFIQKGGE